jgi:hypothetical protein
MNTTERKIMRVRHTDGSNPNYIPYTVEGEILRIGLEDHSPEGGKKIKNKR